MAITNIKEQDIIKALQYIDENGVPSQNQSTKYELITEEGKKYPPQYVIAVAAHIANGTDISNDDFNAVEAKNYLQKHGFDIEVKQEKFELTIKADSIVSTDARFTMDKLTLARHIAKNTPFIGNIAYNQREFSYDNYLMELVRHTIEYIKKKPYGSSLFIHVKDEVRLVTEATQDYELFDRQRIIDENKKNTVRHAYFREYLALQRLCLLILRHEKHQIGKGSRQIYGILFDGAWLWEEYINSLIDGLFYHPMNKGKKGGQRLFDGNIGLIYPDFISRNVDSRVIADAKYKPVGNIGNRDYLQVLAYMLRFDAKVGLYLYPDAVGNNDVPLLLNKGSTYEHNVSPRDDICLAKLGLRIPADVKSYDEFVSQM